MIVLEYAYSYGFSICEARRLTESEKSKYADWYKEIGMVSVGDHIDLPYIQWNHPLVSEILHRPEDGQFNGCGNTVRIISVSEKEQLIALNAQIEAEERANEIAYLRSRLKELEASKLYTDEEAKSAKKCWNDLQNEGGEGYVPHFPTYEEYNAIKRRLNDLENVK